MKQGTGKSLMSGGKTEPKSKAISPGRVSMIGNAQIDGTKMKPMISGPGLKAPMSGQTNHPRGSQGKH